MSRPPSGGQASSGASPQPSSPRGEALVPPSSASIARFGKYDLILNLGHGGMADVFLAVSSGQVAAGFNKLMVIKRLRPNLAEDPDFVAMLVDEARLAARLNHPNVVQTNEIGKVGRQYFIAMEYLDGQPLHHVLLRARKKAGGLPLDLGLTLLCDVLGGLHYAHELTDYDGTPLSIVHRDMSPHNVFVTYAGQVKIVDFGIAKAAGRTSETRDGLIKGKVAYMAPEQPTGAPIDRRADLFAVGVILWDLAVGERMWKDVDELAIFRALVDKKIPRSPKAKNPGVPDEVDRICQKALAPEPADRYASAAEFQADLERYLRSRNAYASHREIGDFVGGLFADKRAYVKNVIDVQLAELRSRSSQALPELQEWAHLTKALDEPAAAATPVKPVSETIVAPLTAGSKQAESLKRMRFIAAILAAIMAVLVVLGAVLILGKPTPPTAQPAAGEEPSSPPPEGGEVRLVLRATPPQTRFSIDDGPPLENPHLSTVIRDGSNHVLTARAPGFKSRTIEISYAADVVLDVSLDVDPEARPAQTAATAAPTPTHAGGHVKRGGAGGRPTAKPPTTGGGGATAEPTAQPNPGHRPVRPIDSASPW